MKNDWIQIISTLAVLAGLTMVIAQLQQSHHQAQAQLILDDYLSMYEHQYSLMGDDPAAAIAKARVSPDQLTDREKIIVNAHLTVEYERMTAYEYIYGRTGLFDGEWESVVPFLVEEYYYYPYAKEWIIRYQQRRQDWSPEVDRAFREYLQANP